MINGFNLDKQTMTLTLSNGETIKSDIASWSITNDKLTVKLANGVETTIAGDVAGWTTLSNGNVKVTFKDGTSQELSADLAKMDLGVDVDVKFNLGAAAYEQWFTKQMNKISQDTLEKVNLDVANNSISDLLGKFDLDDEWWDFNGNWADNDYETTLMAMLIDSIGSMDASQLTPEIQAGIADMISILEQGMASTDAQTREMATMLYQGLAAGLKDCDVDWDAILGAAGLSAEVIASFKKALGIHSPSSLTMALAPWLFEGLKVGIAEADANFDIAPLDGVRSVIAGKFQDAMRGALSDGHLDLNEIPGLDENFVAHYNNIMAMEGETEAEKYEAYKAKIGDKAVEDYIAQKGQEAYDNAVHRNNVNGIRNRDRAAVMLDHDGQIITQPIKPLPRIDPNKARTDAIAAATADQAELDKVRAKAIADFENEFYRQLESTVGKWQQDYIVNKKWNDDASYSNTQKAILNGAVEAALKEGGWANIDDAMADGGEKFLSLVQANIDKSGKNLEIEISDTWNELQDIWVEGLNAMYEAEQELAQKTYELWQKTFTAIANARLGLLDGKSIMESMFDKPEEIASIIETYLNKGMSMDKIMDMLYNRNAQVDFDPWDAESYHNSGAWKYVNRDANGNYTDTTTTQYNNNLREDLTNLASAELADVVGKSLSQTKIDEWASSGDHAKLALLDFLSTKGVVQKNTAEDGSISYAATGKELSKEFIDGIVDMMMQSYKATSQAQVNSYIAEAASVQRAQYYQRADKARQEGEAYINAQQAKFDVVTKAREAMLKGEDLKYALTAEEQKQLLEVTNQSDLAAVSLGDLDSASTTLTNTMILCAQQLGIAMGMIERGEATSFSIDPTTGAVTVTRARTAAEVSAARASGLAHLGVEERDGQYYEIGSNTAITAESDRAGWDAIQEVIRAASSEGVEIALSGNKSNNTGDVLDNAGTGNSDAVQLQYAQAAGFASLQEQDDYIAMMEAQGDDKDYSDGGMLTKDEIIKENAEAWKDLTDEEKAQKALDIQRKFANQLRTMEEGLSELNSSGKEWIKTLKSTNKSIADQAKALKSLRKSYQKVLGLTDEQMESLGEDFLTNEKNLELVQTAAEKAGEKGQAALDELQANAALSIAKTHELTGNYQELATAVSQLNFDAGEMITGTDEAYATLSNLWNAMVADAMAAGHSVEDAMQIANDAITALGYTPAPIELEPITGSLESIQQQIGSHRIETAYDADGNAYPVSEISTNATANGDGTFTIYVPKGVNSGGGTPSAPSSFTKNAEKTGGGGGGGGGGGAPRRRYLNKAKPEDYKERYHEIDNAIDDVTDALERLNKQQDRAWGADRLKSMQAESAELKKQADLIGDKIAEAEAYKAIDLEAAEDWGWKFDEDGNVKNYDENWDKLLAKYNAKVAEYNNMSAAEQEALDKQYEEANDKYWAKYQADMAKAKTEEEKDAVRKKYKKWINPETETAFGSYEEYLKYTMLDAPTAALDQYEETMELLEELGLEMADVLNSWYDNVLEQIQYKLDLALELTENELNIIDYKLKSIEDNAYRAGEALGLMTQKMDASKANFNAYYTALDDLLKANNADWSADKLLSGEITAKDLADAGLQSGDIDIIKTVMEGLRESTAAMTEQMVEGYETMTDSFEQFNEELQRYISTIEHAQNVTSTYKNILDLTGRSMSGFTATMLKELNTLVVEQAQHKLSSNKTTLDTVRKEFETAQAAYKKAQEDFAAGNGDQAALDAAKKAYESAQDNLDEAEENFLTSWEETLQAAADAFESNIEEITRTIGEALSGGLAGGLAELEDQFSKMSEQNDLYVDDYEKIYQLTKLTRDLDSKIDNTTNVRAQREMLKLQKEINGLLESDKKLSQYDIEYLQKKADLKMAEIAMQDAQNAKSQVTMRRDSEGNYNYVYTADEDAVEKAEQEYADKLYEMQVANDEYITTLQENMSALSSQMLNEIASIDRTVYDTEEKYRAEVERITNHYSVMMGNYNSEMKKVLDNNTTLYNEDWTEFNKFTGYKISAAENYVTKWNQTMLSQVTGFDTQEDYYENFNKTLFGDNPESPSSNSLIGQVLAAYRTMAQQIAAANEAAGLEKGTLADLVTEGIDAATDAAEEAAKNIVTQAGLITTAITDIGTKINAMADSYTADFKRMSDATDILNRRLSDFLIMAGSSQEFSIDAGVLSQIRARLDAEGFDTGGYTGSWGSEGKLAFLHQKELVLNAEDTANMLASVGILRQIANVIDLNALTSAGGFISLMSSGVRDNKETLQQEVHIEAHFPNATDKNQIEDAFKDIINLAAQYANRSSF